MSCSFENVHVILVRPQFLGNIGAVARSMKNFCFTNLRLVEAPRSYKDAEARKMAVGAFDILKQACLYSDLKAAIQDLSVVFGTTSNRQRSTPVNLLQEQSHFALTAKENNKIGIVFGDEINGLTDEELDLCHLRVTIATNPDFPSLNLAQAASIVLYELSRNQPYLIGRKTKQTEYPTTSESDELLSQIDELLDLAQFSRSFNRRALNTTLRRMYGRLTPTKREHDILKAITVRLTIELTE